MNIEFYFQGSKIKIPCQLDEKLESVCQHFYSKENTDLGSLLFLYQGKVLQDEMNLNIENIIAEFDKERNEMSIIVRDNREESYKANDERIKSNNIICPECWEISEIKIEDYRFSILECRNNHSTKDKEINKLEETQFIDLSKILCDECKLVNKSQTYHKYFYRCNTCKLNLCPLCNEKHSKINNGHKIIKYDEKDFKCPEHNLNFSCYCKDCITNLCQNCLGAHPNHKIVSFVRIINENELNIKVLKKNLETIKNNLEEIKFKSEKLISKLRQNLIFKY